VIDRPLGLYNVRQAYTRWIVEAIAFPVNAVAIRSTESRKILHDLKLSWKLAQYDFEFSCQGVNWICRWFEDKSLLVISWKVSTWRWIILALPWCQDKPCSRPKCRIQPRIGCSYAGNPGAIWKLVASFLMAGICMFFSIVCAVFLAYMLEVMSTWTEMRI
jgi:hypothetical protein